MITMLAIFIGFISPLLFTLTQTQVSDAGKAFIKKTLNFEISLFIISLLVGLVPVLGILAGIGFWIFNLLVCINANNAINKNTPFSYPFSFDLIK